MEREHETHISTEQIKKSENTRLSEKDVDETGKKDHQEKKGKGQSSSVGVIAEKARN
jgi:hypothetical protein